MKFIASLLFMAIFFQNVHAQIFPGLYERRQERRRLRQKRWQSWQHRMQTQVTLPRRQSYRPQSSYGQRPSYNIQQANGYIQPQYYNYNNNQQQSQFTHPQQQQVQISQPQQQSVQSQQSEETKLPQVIKQNKADGSDSISLIEKVDSISREEFEGKVKVESWYKKRYILDKNIADRLSALNSYHAKIDELTFKKGELSDKLVNLDIDYEICKANKKPCDSIIKKFQDITGLNLVELKSAETFSYVRNEIKKFVQKEYEKELSKVLPQDLKNGISYSEKLQDLPRRGHLPVQQQYFPTVSISLDSLKGEISKEKIMMSLIDFNSKNRGRHSCRFSDRFDEENNTIEIYFPIVVSFAKTRRPIINRRRSSDCLKELSEYLSKDKEKDAVLVVTETAKVLEPFDSKIHGDVLSYFNNHVSNGERHSKIPRVQPAQSYNNGHSIDLQFKRASSGVVN